MERDNKIIVDSYNSIAKFLHWSIGILIILNYISGLTLDVTEHKFIDWHKQFGLLILILVVLRILWRIFSKYPGMDTEISPFERLSARVGHYFLYVLMLAIPILGIVLVQAHGYSLKFLGIINIPTVISLQTHKVAHLIKEYHEYLAHAIIIFVVLHVLFALKHHFINKNSVLLRMIPRHNKR